MRRTLERFGATTWFHRYFHALSSSLNTSNYVSQPCLRPPSRNAEVFLVFIFAQKQLRYLIGFLSSARTVPFSAITQKWKPPSAAICTLQSLPRGHLKQLSLEARLFHLLTSLCSVYHSLLTRILYYCSPPPPVPLSYYRLGTTFFLSFPLSPDSLLPVSCPDKKKATLAEE